RVAIDVNQVCRHSTDHVARGLIEIDDGIERLRFCALRADDASTTSTRLGSGFEVFRLYILREERCCADGPQEKSKQNRICARNQLLSAAMCRVVVVHRRHLPMCDRSQTAGLEGQLVSASTNKTSRHDNAARWPACFPSLERVRRRRGQEKKG